MSATATDPIPVRALNQVTYCPRLYYLQYVDCVMPTNEHVEGGLFDHRRVDDPELKNKTRTDRGTATSRHPVARSVLKRICRFAAGPPRRSAMASSSTRLSSPAMKSAALSAAPHRPAVS